jgi:anti-sigma-K factor RskA
MSAGEDHVDREGCGANAAPYVLGALSEAEHDAFRRHMESCAVCREEVGALQVVAAALPAAAPQVSAPAQLKRRVMSSVREDARRRSQPSDRARPSRSASRRWRPAVAAVALAAVVAALAIALVPGGSGGSDGSGGTRVIRADVSIPRASAVLHLSGGRAQLTVASMPQAARGHVYQVWVKRSAGPQPTDALFTVTSHGAASVGVPGSVDGVREVMVTSEPLGGSRAPTSAPVIVARLG